MAVLLNTKAAIPLPNSPKKPIEGSQRVSSKRNLRAAQLDGMVKKQHMTFSLTWKRLSVHYSLNFKHNQIWYRIYFGSVAKHF